MTDGDRSRAGASAWLMRREFRVDGISAWVGRRRIALILVLGVFARVAQFLANRRNWLDEDSLAQNIVSKTYKEMFGPLSGAQLAPPGFLLVERFCFQLLGDRPFVLKIFPLLCGIAALFLFVRVAERCLRPNAVWIALALFAVSDDLIYFASELKQYSTDVAMGLLCDLLALDLLVSRPAQGLRLVRFTVVGAVVVWFSHPVAFVLAGLGIVLIASALAERAWKKGLCLALMCMVWGGSFVFVYVVSQEQLGHRGTMWAFWAFAFPPRPWTVFGGAEWLVRSVLYLFANPIEIQTPLGPTLSALLSFGFFLIGCASFVRRKANQPLGMLVAPGLITLFASCLHLYPFHGRLLLFLVPALLLLIAEGVAWVIEWVGSRAFQGVLLGGLFLLPTLQATYHLFEPRQRTNFNSRGDRRPENLEPTHFPF
ncbi:glycosyltransferase family 39 protein [Singulisphaera acidiphila]|uniref:Glycosyltransferase RgtA/B/C/D-like domain-containing protein n=1 Tax=Singulisphaera acidiphila (strain ATCC BAA-1392 / DSM 18658 / VKM B-2454 / MOB10) TaxID=886293 RepID=L0DPJ4_SINAD|nr:glycosyltransferase family 39 protein [Singulisphaera acidiphila]AGA31167.1 hypothetical protein Sinac_7113 [Singulisphaera acidiphila DSM 18658]